MWQNLLTDRYLASWISVFFSSKRQTKAYVREDRLHGNVTSGRPMFVGIRVCYKICSQKRYRSSLVRGLDFIKHQENELTEACTFVTKECVIFPRPLARLHTCCTQDPRYYLLCCYCLPNTMQALSSAKRPQHRGHVC